MSHFKNKWACLSLMAGIVLCSWCAQADLKQRYVGANYSIAGSNGEVTNDVSGVSLEYQHQVDFIQMFSTPSPYKWYFDVAATASYLDLEDPVARLGLPAAAYSTADLKAANYILEIGFSRRQLLTSFMQWELGARVGGFGVSTSTMSGVTDTSQVFHVESSTSMGLTISAFSGIIWEISESYTIDTLFQLRKHYLSQFTVHDTISGLEFKYPDYVSFGISIGISRGF